MGGKRASKSELFLMELIFSILFFSITSAVCVSLFVNARLTSIQSSQLTAASLQAQSAAESFKASSADLEDTAQLLNAAQTPEGNLQVFYDKDWKPTSPEAAVYLLELIPDDTDQPLHCATIHVSQLGNEDSPLFSLTVTEYVR